MAPKTSGGSRPLRFQMRLRSIFASEAPLGSIFWDSGSIFGRFLIDFWSIFNLTTLQPFNPSTIQPYSPTTLQPFNPTALQPYNHSTLQPYNPTTLQTYNPSALQPYNPTALQPHRLNLGWWGLRLGVKNCCGCRCCCRCC